MLWRGEDGGLLGGIVRIAVTEEDGRKVAARWHDVERGESVVCDVPEVYGADVKGVREMMRRMTAELRKEPVVFRDGTEATISGRTQREVQSHSADRRMVAAYAKIRELAAAAQYLHSAQNPGFTGEKGSNGIAQYHYYVAKGDFGEKGEAFVCIRVAEYADGSRVYDIDTDSVEGVINEKGEAPTLPATRIPNAGQEGEASLSRSRIHAVKRFVNYVDKNSGKKVGGGDSSVTFSVEGERATEREEMFFWLDGTTKRAEPQKMTLYEYGVTDTIKEEAAVTRGALEKKFLALTDAAMYDAQFFDAISSVPEMREWTGGLPCPFAAGFLRRMGGGVTK